MISDNHPKLVLVADDDPDIREIVCSAVSLMKCIPVVACNGEEAIDKLKETTVDLLILDVMMPGLTGTQVCETFKATETGKVTPVLILTARDSIDDKVKAFDGGADDYLTKPFNFKELQSRVKALLRIREMNLILQEKNVQLQQMQQKLVEGERQSAVNQLVGAAAHQLGQPISALLLNAYLLEQLPSSDERYKKAMLSVKNDIRRLAEIVESLKQADANQKEGYYKDLDILTVGNPGKS